MDGVDLDVVLDELRAQFAAAALAAAQAEVAFPVQSVTVELKVGLSRTREGKAGFRVPFVGVDIGASGEATRDILQTITVVLGPPVDREGVPIQVSDARADRPG